MTLPASILPPPAGSHTVVSLPQVITILNRLGEQYRLSAAATHCVGHQSACAGAAAVCAELPDLLMRHAILVGFGGAHHGKEA